MTFINLAAAILLLPILINAHEMTVDRGKVSDWLFNVFIAFVIGWNLHIYLETLL